MKTLYQTCVIICITMIFFTLTISFVDGLGIFDPVEEGFDTSGNSSDIFNRTTNIETTEGGFGMDALWLAVLGGGGIAAVVLAWATRSPIIIGVYVFSAVFWAAYLNSLSIVSSLVPGEFLVIGTVGMFFAFAGAIAGMLSGSG